MLAAHNNALQLVEKLKGIEAKMQDNLGRTALMYACEGGHYEVFLALVHEEY